MDLIIQYVATITPSVVAILTAIAAVIIAFNKIKSATTDTNNETKALRKDVSAVMRENLELKKELRRVMRRAYRIRGDEDGQDK